MGDLYSLVSCPRNNLAQSGVAGRKLMVEIGDSHRSRPDPATIPPDKRKSSVSVFLGQDARVEGDLGRILIQHPGKHEEKGRWEITATTISGRNQAGETGTDTRIEAGT